LRLLILVGACGAFVAVLRNHAEIVLAHANRQSPKSAAFPFPQGSHSLADVARWSPSVERMVHANRYRPERREGPVWPGG
jgi:hypothetical protein